MKLGEIRTPRRIDEAAQWTVRGQRDTRWYAVRAAGFAVVTGASVALSPWMEGLFLPLACLAVVLAELFVPEVQHRGDARHRAETLRAIATMVAFWVTLAVAFGSAGGLSHLLEPALGNGALVVGLPLGAVVGWLFHRCVARRLVDRLTPDPDEDDRP